MDYKWEGREGESRMTEVFGSWADGSAIYRDGRPGEEG